MVEKTRDLENALGDGIKRVEENEKETVIMQQRSICVSRDLQVGTIIKEHDLAFLRPCPLNSIKPYEIDKVLGKTLTKNLKKGEGLFSKYLSE